MEDKVDDPGPDTATRQPGDTGERDEDQSEAHGRNCSVRGSPLLTATACGTTINKTGSAPTSAAPARTAPAAAPATTPSNTDPVGTAYTVSGTGDNAGPMSHTVTLIKFLPNAQPDNSFDAAPAGSRMVGAEFKITGVTGISTDDANSNAVVSGSNQEEYQPAFSGLAAGTNFNYGTFNVTVGQTQVGRVAFQIPTTVSTVTVRWAPELSGASATWTVK